MLLHQTARLLATFLVAPALCGCSTTPTIAVARQPAPGPAGMAHRRAHDGPTRQICRRTLGHPARPGARPALRIGTSDDYAPFSRNGSGFDIAVAKRMAADLGLRITWVPFAWPELESGIRDDAFDVAMGGITWRPQRSVIGWMTRAVAIGGPCVVTRGARGPVAVNRGGVLEAWARAHFPADRIRTVDANESLPALLEDRTVAAIKRPGLRATCEPSRDRKVYWVGPERAKNLGPCMDAWLARNERLLRGLRTRFLGQDAAFGPVPHLVDMLARRLELMPSVAAYKRAHDLPIEDRRREERVLQQAVEAAARAGLDAGSVRAFFAQQIALAKAVQERAIGAPPMDLDSVLRPALSTLDQRIVEALAAAASELHGVRSEQLDLVVPMTNAAERDRLLAALRAVRPAATAGAHADSDSFGRRHAPGAHGEILRAARADDQ